MTANAVHDDAAGDPPQLREFAERLHALSEELADLALEQLHQAVGAGGSGETGADDGHAVAVALERRITRARRAVERAAAVLEPPIVD